MLDPVIINHIHVRASILRTLVDHGMECFGFFFCQMLAAKGASEISDDFIKVIHATYILGFSGLTSMRFPAAISAGTTY